MAPALLRLAFVLIVLLPKNGAQNYRCPLLCECLGTMVGCGKKGLDSIPSDLPTWVTILELQGNNIDSVPDDAFHGLDKLEELDLSSNKLTSFNASSLTPTPLLNHLKLSYNELTEMPVLNPRTNITQLILHHNLISRIHYQAIERLPRVRTLDLSYNQITELLPATFPLHPAMHTLSLNNNKISTIEKGSLDNLTNLEWLKLNKNKINHLPKNVFSNLKALKTLEMKKNRLRVIEGLSFQGLERLTSLNLRRNQIRDLMDGAFWGLSALQNLYLDNNNITEVSKGWLYGLSALQHLSISHNAITEIDPDGWDPCQLLWHLDMSHNQMEMIMKNTFEKLRSLKHLLFSHNRISLVEGDAFSQLQSLNVLELNNNHISWTVEDMNEAFSGMSALTRLDLSSNRIRTISKRAFSGLDSLRQLNLMHNAISTIFSNAFSPLEQLQELKMNSSNLICDCQLSWLPRWLREAGFESFANLRCAHPQFLANQSVFEVQRNEFECEDFPKPIIITHPDDQFVLRGANVSLKCAAASTSTNVDIEWRKNNILVPIQNVKNTATTNDGDSNISQFTSVLTLINVSDDVEGKYQCIISNHLGSVHSRKSEITVYVYPAFSKTPDDVTVRAGTTARLECAAHGYPAPQIAWQKDGGDDFPAARERRMHIMPNDDVFFIVTVKSSDQGVYSCTATNEAGTIVANATVNVLETPAFTKPMEDKYSEEGKTTVLECMASGSPKPKLDWKKDGEALVLTDRHFFTAENQLLIIVQTKPSDAGRYSCEMSNTLGTERGSSSLSVISLNPGDDDVSGGLDDDSTTTGIIIIAVVCCVVGTSLIWVIIIYQTRKKTEEYSSTPTDETTIPGEMNTPYHAGSERSPLANSFGKYTGVEIAEHESLRRLYGSDYAKARLGGFYPSDGEDEPHSVTMPLTGGAIGGEDSGNEADGIGAMHRLHASDSDMTHSSSPSTRSTQSTGVLHTFHPNGPPGHARLTASCSASPARDSPTTAAVAVVHAMPHSVASRPQCVTHTLDGSLHNPRPPDTGQAPLGVYENVHSTDSGYATFPLGTSLRRNSSDNSLPKDSGYAGLDGRRPISVCSYPESSSPASTPTTTSHHHHHPVNTHHHPHQYDATTNNYYQMPNHKSSSPSVHQPISSSCQSRVPPIHDVPTGPTSDVEDCDSCNRVAYPPPPPQYDSTSQTSDLTSSPQSTPPLQATPPPDAHTRTFNYSSAPHPAHNQSQHTAVVS